jgi:preprotein translocase subunit SecG
MTRKVWLNLAPSLLIAVAIIASTYVAGLTAKSGWLFLAAPLLMSLAILGADVMNSRLRGNPSGLSRVALWVTGSFLLSCLIITLIDSALVKTLIPTVGATSWISLLRPNTQRKACRTA